MDVFAIGDSMLIDEPEASRSTTTSWLIVWPGKKVTSFGCRGITAAPYVASIEIAPTSWGVAGVPKPAAVVTNKVITPVA